MDTHLCWLGILDMHDLPPSFCDVALKDPFALYHSIRHIVSVDNVHFHDSTPVIDL